MHVRRTGVIGKKIGMTQIFSEQGERIGVTVIHAGQCVVLGKKTDDVHGYSAVQIGYGQKPLRLCNDAELGVAKKLKIEPARVIKEIRLDAKQAAEFEVGKEVALASVFKPGTFVDIVGVSKGKGTQGVIKRHHMRASRNTHGTHEFFRHGGSIGCRMTPGRVHKGKRMPGHMGTDICTVQNMALVQVVEDEGLLIVRGAVPGGKNGIVMVKNAKKRTGMVRFGEAVQDTKKKAQAAKKPAAAKKK